VISFETVLTSFVQGTRKRFQGDGSPRPRRWFTPSKEMETPSKELKTLPKEMETPSKRIIMCYFERYIKELAWN